VFLVGGGSDVMFIGVGRHKGISTPLRFRRDGAAIGLSGTGHDAVVYGSLKDQVAWIASRFAGDPAPSDCRGLAPHHSLRWCAYSEAFGRQSMGILRPTDLSMLIWRRLVGRPFVTSSGVSLNAWNRWAFLGQLRIGHPV